MFAELGATCSVSFQIYVPSLLLARGKFIPLPTIQDQKKEKPSIHLSLSPYLNISSFINIPPPFQIGMRN